MVYHDTNQTIYFSFEVIGLKNGMVEFRGSQEVVIDLESIKKFYGIELDVNQIDGKKFVLTV